MKPKPMSLVQAQAEVGSPKNPDAKPAEHAISSTIESRVAVDPYAASILRRRLELRHEVGTACRAALDKMNDAELMAQFFQSQRQHRDRAAAARRRHAGRVILVS